MLNEKIRAIREEYGYTQKDFAKEFNISYGTLQSYEYGETQPKLKFLENLSKRFKIPMNYFYENNVVNMSPITEKMSSICRQSKNFSPNVSKSQISSPKTYTIPTNLTNSQIEQIQNDQIYIISLNSAVGAGESVDIEGIEVFDSDILIPFSKLLFKTPPNYAKLRCMRVEGYSMMPMLYPDSWVIAEISQEFVGDGLYIINFSGNFMVKMLQKSPNGTLEIISINKDYKSYALGEDDNAEVQIIAKVLRCVI